MLFEHNKSTYVVKYLVLAALAMMLMLTLSACRYRITEDSYANMTAEDEDGTVRETYDYLREDLEYDGSATPIFTAGRSHQQVENPFYEEPQPFVEEDIIPEDSEEEEDAEDEDGTGTSSVISTPSVTRPSTTTATTNKVTVTLNPNGGKCTTSSISVTPGLTYGYLATPTRKGYEFKGWYSAKKKGSKITSTTKVTKKSNHTIYAHWQDLKTKKYTITLNPQGGKTDTKKLKMTTNSKYEDLPIPTKKNNAFTGWYTSASGGELINNGSKFKGKADTTIYAHWEDALTYWSDRIEADNTEIRNADIVSYYYETSDGDGLSGDDILYNFKGENILSDDNEVSDDWIMEQNPSIIIKAVKSMDDEEAALEELNQRFEGYPGQIYIVSSEAADGTDKVRAYYTLWLGSQIPEYSGVFGQEDLDKAATELGVDVG